MRLPVLLALLLALVSGKKTKQESHLKGSSKTSFKTCSTQCLDQSGPGGHSPSVCGHNKSPPTDELIAYQSLADVDQACCCIDCENDFNASGGGCVCYTADENKCVLYTTTTA